MSTKERKYHFIYKTTNVLTGRYYYGMHSTDDLDDGYLGSGKRLRYSIRKYGEENHKREIIEYCKNKKELNQKEMEVVNLDEIAKEKCMNIMIGGQGGYHKNCFGGKEGNSRGGLIAGNIHKVKIKNDPEFRKRVSKNVSIGNKKAYKEGRRKKGVFCDWTGRKHKEESKKLIGQKSSIHQKGSGNSQYGTCWIYKGKENKKIKKEELNDYMKRGWDTGRIL